MIAMIDQSIFSEPTNGSSVTGYRVAHLAVSDARVGNDAMIWRALAQQLVLPMHRPPEVLVPGVR